MIILMRHAETLGGKGRYVGTTDLALSESGRKQATALSGAVRGLPVKALYTSPLGRARDTAAPVAAGLGLETTTLPELAEISLGEWEGRTFEEVRRNDPQAYEARGQDFEGFRPPGGESFSDLAERAIAALELMSAQPLPCLAVTHAGVIRVALCRALGLPLNDLFSFSPRETCCTLLARGKSGFALQGYNCPVSGLNEFLNAAW